MISDQEITDLALQFQLEGRQWHIGGELRTPTAEEIKIVIQDCVDTIRGTEESISIEIGGLLVKKTDDWIDIYRHVAELEFDD